MSVPATPTAVIAETTTWAAFPSLWRELLDEVWAFVRQTGLAAGRNVMLYRDDRPSVEVGVEAPGPFERAGRVRPSSLPAGLAATTTARGAPSPAAIGDAHRQVVDWCAANGYALDGTRWEIYDHWRDDADPEDYGVAVYWLVEPTA